MLDCWFVTTDKMGGSQSHSSPKDVEHGRVRQNPQKIYGLSRLMNAKADHNRTVAIKGWDKHDENMKNTQLLKGLYKTLDPTMMKVTEDVRGEIQLSFKYDFKRSLLLVKVIKCRDLRMRDLRTKMPDPYVRLILMPDEEGMEPKKTAVTRGDSEPRFDEIFAFPLDEQELMSLKMIVDVLDDDITGQDDNLGQVIIDLNSFNFKENPTHTAWYMLARETDFTVAGDLEITLAYQLPTSLWVTVHRASRLPPRSDGKPADVFVKMNIPGTKTFFQTHVKKQTLDPEWEESFEFEVAKEEFGMRQVIFHAIDEDKDSGNESLGQVVINLTDFDPDQGLYGSYKLADLRSTKCLRSKWAQHSVMQEFRQSLAAHAQSKTPKILYGPHAGQTVVSVSCRKAGAYGKMRMVEGIPIK